MAEYEFFLTHSLEKVFPDQRPAMWFRKEEGLEGFSNEMVSFQLVYTAVSKEEGMPLFDFDVKVEGAEARMRKVELLASDFPHYAVYDQNYLTTQSGLFPDLLLPFDGRIRPIPGQMRSIWIDLYLTGKKPGDYEICISATALEETECGNGTRMKNPYGDTQNWRQTIPLKVLPGCLPKQELLHTEWFHADCLADYYQLPAFGERHWEIVENFIRFASEESGVNVLLTPIFTQPLDTAVGGERTTVQLIDIEKKGENYIFCFEKLRRWCELCKKYGIEFIEIVHFFTQWGAGATPKIIAVTEQGEQQIFGWHVEAVSPEYRTFLKSLVPQLLKKLEEFGYGKENLIFHISDEPRAEQIDQYLAAKRQVEDLLEGCLIMDALSSYEFYQKGAVKHPIPANNHIQPFLDHDVKDLWVYYCCAQCVDVPNRFYAMPSARNRIMGVLMYLYGIKGFLHWGYNFYNAAFSKKHIDPFKVTHSDYAFPSGDPYLVYPGEDGTPLSSIRNQVQMEALNDLRALKMLESLSDRSFTKHLITEGIPDPITFTNYPVTAQYLLNLRGRVNAEIIKRMR